MPFLEDLAQGFSAAAGSTYGVESIEKKKQRRQALSDAELQNQTQQILGDVQTLNQRRSQLDKSSPTYQQDLQSIDQALHDARGVFTDLYHPENNPGALSKLGGFIQAHIGRHKGRQAAPATPAAAKKSIGDRMAGIESAAYAPGQTPDKMREIENSFERQFGRPMTAEEKKPYFAHAYGGAPLEPKETPTKYQGQLTETTDEAGKKHYWRVPLEQGGPPEEVDFQGQAVSPKGGQKPPTANQTTLEAYENAFDPPVKYADMKPEQKAFFPRWKAMQTAGETTGQYVAMVTQPNGTIVPVTIQRTGGKTFPGATPPGLRQPEAPTAAPPKTPGEARSRVTPPAGAGVISKGAPVGGRLTGPQASAQKEYDTAVGLVKFADEVATKPEDAVNQKRLAVRLERESAGRFTGQALAYVVKLGWGTSLEQALNNVTTGAFPPELLRQLVDGAHELQREKEAALKASGITPAGAVDQDVDDIMRALRQQNQATPPPK